MSSKLFCFIPIGYFNNKSNTYTYIWCPKFASLKSFSMFDLTFYCAFEMTLNATRAAMAMALVEAGYNKCRIARTLGVP